MFSSCHSFGLSFQKAQLTATLFLSFSPCWSPLPDEPSGVYLRQHMKQVSRPLYDGLQPTKSTERGKHRRGIRSLFSSYLDPAARTNTLKH